MNNISKYHVPRMSNSDNSAFNDLVNDSMQYSLSDLAKGNIKGKGSGKFRFSAANRVAVIDERIKRNLNDTVADREAAANILEQKQKRWQYTGLKDLVIETGFLADNLRLLKGNDLVNAVEKNNVPEVVSKAMNYDEVFRKEDLVEKVEQPSLVELYNADKRESLRTKVGNFASYVVGGVADRLSAAKKLALENSYGITLSKAVVGLSAVALIAISLGVGKVYYDRVQAEKNIPKSKIEIIEKEKGSNYSGGVEAAEIDLKAKPVSIENKIVELPAVVAPVVKEKLGDKLVNKTITYVREQAQRNPGFEHFGVERRGLNNLDDRIKEDLTAVGDNLYDSFGDFTYGADQLTKEVDMIKKHGRNGVLGSVANFTKHVATGILDIATSPFSKEGKIKKLKKGLGGVVIKPISDTLDIAGAGVHVGEDILTAGVKAAEIPFDATIGHFNIGADITSGTSNLTQAVIVTAGDIGVVSLAAYKAPVAGAILITGSNGSREVLDTDFGRLARLDWTGMPVVNNFINGEGHYIVGGVPAISEAELRRAMNDNYDKNIVRDIVNTAGTFWNLFRLERKSEDYRNRGRDNEVSEKASGEEVIGEKPSTTEASTQTTTTRRPSREEPNFDFTDNDELLDRPGDIGSNPGSDPLARN